MARSQGQVPQKCLPEVRYFGGKGRWIIASTRYSPGNTRLLGRMARSGDRAPQAVYRKCRGLRSGPCTARQGEPRSGERALWRVFSFSALRKGGAPAGAQRSGSGGERRKERSLSGIFGFSRKWSGGVSSDDMGGAMNQPSSWLNLPRPSGREKASPGQSGQPSLKPRQKTWREPPSQPGSHPPRPGGQTPESPRC